MCVSCMFLKGKYLYSSSCVSEDEGDAAWVVKSGVLKLLLITGEVLEVYSDGETEGEPRRDGKED